MQPQPPSTPVRGRTPTRYPDGLSRGEPGRVPLHRRGTSRTLECLEDLLRENGYKETRVFTPEAERAEAMAEERRRQTSAWRIRELLTGWLPGAGGSHAGSDDEETAGPQKTHRPATPTPVTYRSTPNSPLSHMRPLDHTRAPHPISSPNSASSTTLSSTRSSVTSEGRRVSYQPTRREIHDRIPAIRAETSRASLRPYAQASAAHRYLRHMASTPDMPTVRAASIRQVASPHPLPASWLESVTKAVLKSGDGGAHVGGPIQRPSSRQSERPPRGSKENSRPSKSKSHILGRSASGLPPGATLLLKRPQTAPSAVNTAHVVCRSAPGSRSASRVGDRLPPTGRGPARNERPRPGRRGSRLTQPDRVPSLAATQVEHDTWSSGTHWVDGKRVPVLHYEDIAYDEAFDSDDDEDGELDLARLLVPPKRQYSIQSLRKHLHVAHTQTHALALNTESWEDEEGTTRGRGRPVHIDDSDGYPTFARMDSKQRHGLPGAWGNSGRGRS